MLTTAVVLCLGALALFAQVASAETFGQIGSAWGTSGTGKAQFRNPGMFGVDPVDGSVYAGDITGDNSNYRIQKLTAAGAFKASVLIPRFPEAEKLVALHGVAVDHAKERFYVVDGCRVATGSGTCKKTGSLFSARHILAFKTAPEGEALVSAGSFDLPEGAEELYTPQSIAVDPSNGDILVMAEDAAKHIVIQRVSSTGTLGARFVDTSDVLKPAAGREATSIAVGPTGITYTLTGATSPGEKFTRAWQLPSNLSGVSQVSGFAAAAEAEKWFYGLESKKSTPSPSFGGPQIAISPDGETLYWKESLTPSSEAEAGSVLVRGYSLSGNKTSVLYGGSQGSSCKITTSPAGIATTGNRLLVFDYGQVVTEENAPAYGDNVLTFGPGGSGCPAPTAKFTINGSEMASVEVDKDATVTFDAGGSELFGGFRRELIWKFGDGTEKTVKFTPAIGDEPEEEAEPTVTHQYTTGGNFAVQLEIKLSAAVFGNPQPAEHHVLVAGPALFKLTVSKTGSGTVTSSPTGIDCGSDCDEEYEEDKSVTLTASPSSGFAFSGWSGGGCSGTGTCQVTMSGAKNITANFTAVPGQVSLKVEKAGLGTGTVTSTPGNINCGGICEAAFAEGEVVTLTGVAGANSKAVQWTGCGGVTVDGKCEVTMSAAKKVTATFDLEQHLLKVAKGGSGTGTVISLPSGIDCGSTCQASFNHGAVVTLKGVSGAITQAVQWTGCDSIVGANECKVTISAAKQVTATFDANPTTPPPSGESSSPPPVVSPPPVLPVEPKPKLTPKQKALAACKKLKGKAKAKCVKKANSIGKPKKHRRGRG
jgi:Divergent InlB B-repeat domain/PKD domain